LDIPPGSSTCTICGEEKDNTNFSFYKNRFTRDGYRLRVNRNCKKCSINKNKERHIIKNMIDEDRPKPHDGLCECCGGYVPNKSNWQWDHCPANKVFRGWICKKCNTGIGLIGDSLESVMKVVSYLERAKLND
jgi:hypothetical protein